MADAVDVVGHAHLQRVERVEDVELGDGDLRHRVQPDGVAQHHCVEPAGATATFGVDAVLVAQVHDLVAGGVEELRRHRTGSHTRDIRLGDADHPIDVAWSDTGADTGSTRDRVGGRDERIGAVVQVQERRLGAFEQHVLAALEGLVDERHRVGDVGRHPGGDLGQVALGHLVGVEPEAVVHLGQHQVLLGQHRREFLAEDVRVEQVLDPQPHPAGLVRVRRTDAAFGRTELVLAEVPLDEAVELLVVRQDQVGVARHPQPGTVDPTRLESVDLGQHDDRIDHDAVADDRSDVVVQDTGRDQLQGEGLAVDDEGVPRIVAALVADDQLHLLGDEVGEFPLALITPLGAHHDGRRHADLLGLPLGNGHGSSAHRDVIPTFAM